MMKEQYFVRYVVKQAIVVKNVEIMIGKLLEAT